MTRRLPFKKRNIITVLFGILIIQAVVRHLFDLSHSSEASWSIGTLMLPGDGEVSQTFTMPVSGSFRVALLSINDGSIQKIPGTPFNWSACKNSETKPNIDLTKYRQGSPEMDEHYKKLSAYSSRQTRCSLDSRFGVLEIELKIQSENKVDTRLSSNMYQVNPPPTYGTAIADFRRYDKGTEFQLNVRSTLNEAHKNRERIPYQVMIHPNRLECSKLILKVGELRDKCE